MRDGCRSKLLLQAIFSREFYRYSRRVKLINILIKKETEYAFAKVIAQSASRLLRGPHFGVARAGARPIDARATTPRVHARMRDRNYYLTQVFDDELKIMICGHRPRDPATALIPSRDTINVCSDLSKVIVLGNDPVRDSNQSRTYEIMQMWNVRSVIAQSRLPF